MKKLKEEFFNIWDKIEEVSRRERKYIVLLWVFALFTYFLIASQNLTNTYDGLWSGTWYRAGKVEMGSGRWFWPYIDIFHFAIQSGPVNTCFTLLMITVSLGFVKDLFLKEEKIGGYLAGATYISSVVVCVALSYRHMAPISGLAFFLSVISACVVVYSKNIITGIVYAIIPLSFSLGLYQTHIENIAVILLLYMVYMIYNGRKFNDLKAYIVKSVSTVLGGAILYRIFLAVNLKIWRMELSTYHGASSVSVSKIIRTLPVNIIRTYQEWIAYFCNNKFAHNIIQLKVPVFYLGVFLVLIAVALMYMRKLIADQYWLEIILAVCAILIIPVAASFILLITPDADVQIQMTNGLALVIPVYMYLFCGIEETHAVKTGRKQNAVIGVWTLICIFIAYGNFYMVIIDQEEMRESKAATTTMATNILEDLKDYGYFAVDEEKTITVVGQASANKFYKKSGMYKNSNAYAKVGQFWTGADCMRMSWEGVFREYTPCELEFCEDERYTEIVKEEKFKNMPVFPNPGYIEDFGDTVVVKVSEGY